MNFAQAQLRHLTRFAPLLLAAGCLLLIHSCTSLSFGATEASLADEVKDAQRALEELETRSIPIVQRVRTPFALKKSHVADFEWMEHTIADFVFEAGDLQGLLSAVTDQAPPDIRFSVFIKNEQATPVDYLDYTGTLGGLIRIIGARFGLDFQPGPHTLVWRDHLVRVFDVPHLAGKRDFLLGRSGGGGSGIQGSQGVIGASGVDEQYASSTSTGDFWTDLEKQLNTIVGSDGDVAVSSSSTLVTVRAPVPQMRQVEDFFTSLNRQLTIQIALDVRLIQVNLFSQFQFGVDWSIVEGCAGGDTSANSCLRVDTGSSAEEFAASSVNTTGISPLRIQTTDTTSGDDATSLLLELLQAQGSTKMLTNPRAITLNNQATQISLTTQTSYVAKSEIGKTEGGDAAQTATLEPGTIETGFSLICLPKVTVDGDILLDVSTRIASLAKLENFGPADETQIQLPSLNESRFFHRARMRSGETLVLGGIRELAISGDGGLLPLKSQSRRDRVERILLITPRLL